MNRVPPLAVGRSVAARSIAARWMAAVALGAVGLTANAGELRVWTSAGGEFSTVAEMVRIERGTVLVLRKPSGAEIKVSLAKLSPEDRRFALGQSGGHEAGDGAIAAAPRATTAAEVESEASRAATANEAAMACEFHLAAGTLPPNEQAKVEARLEHWRALADEGLVRLGTRWATKDQAKEARKAARAKIDLALELLRLRNGKLAEQTLLEASELDPNSGEADFVRGLVHGAIDDDDRQAARCFGECVRRDPGDVAALNNLALSEFFCRDYRGAVEHWLQAVELSPEAPALSQNLGSLLAAASMRGVKVPRGQLQDASEAYAKLLADHGHKRPDSFRFVYVPPKRFAPKTQVNGEGDLISVGSGTGFVVAPGLLLTNEHVVENAEGLLLVDPADSKRRLPATVVAVDADTDLALVRCETLKAEPMPLCGQLPGRAADVMVLGYPLGMELGLQLKSTRGSIVALPAPESEDLVLYDAITNPGNSGGPLCDDAGRVVGVVRALFRGEGGGAYGAAIPMSRAIGFLRLHGVSPTIDESDATPLGWPEVDQRRAPATVLVLNRQRVAGDAEFGRDY
ncbi:MAG: trypsin-like peptidase domain-containing protein [Lacipirellulaceae bacterium]